MMVSKKPKVSVIIPNYNHSAYLTQRIESVLAQTYQDFELIILDDCSTDSSRQVIDTYRDHPKIAQIVYNEVNSGSTFKQWDKGVSLASGEYIWFAESDDWCERDMLDDLVKGMGADQDCSISYCQSYCLEDSGRIRFTSFHNYLSDVVGGREYISKYLTLRQSIFNASMAIWKKSHYEKISKDYMTYKFCGDWRFWIELANCGKVHISGKVRNYFRKHANDVSGKMYKSGLNYLEELRVFNALIDNGYIDRKRYQQAIKKFLKEYFNNRSNIPQDARDAIESRFSEIRYDGLSGKFNLYLTKYRYLLKYSFKGTKHQKLSYL